MEATREEQLLCARVVELAETAEYATTHSCFLTPRERLLIHEALLQNGRASSCFFWGGCRGCERTMAVFPAPWWLTDTPPVVKGGFVGATDPVREAFFLDLLTSTPGLVEEIPITALRITGSGFAALTHRDFLGAILAIGLERSVLGEIVVDAKGALVFTTPEIEKYLMENLTRIGRDAVQCTHATVEVTMEVPRQYEMLSITAASPRVDGVVRGLTNLSREDAAALVRTGMVERNYEPIVEVDKQLLPGDILSIRGYGKFCIDRTDEETKRGRRRILCRKYR